MIRSNETLEQRVADRTARLDQARADAERVNDAKSRFLAAIGHDLLQPLHAAQLFTDALVEQLPAQSQRATAQQIRGALDSTGDLLSGLLDMSRLEAGGLVPQPRMFPLTDVLEPLASEFRALAAEHGLRFRYRATRAWVHTDPQLLRRVLQNFLANAVRYTQHGGVLLGVRRVGGALRIEVHDTGPGIPDSQQRLIFEEFRRGEGAIGQGLGLGLAIADRIAHLLDAPLRLRSKCGRGTLFSLSLASIAPLQQEATPSAAGFEGLRVLIVDNDSQALTALRTILESWQCRVDAVTTYADADALLDSGAHHALWLFDYHLDDGDTGVALYARLSARFGVRPTMILSADDSGEVRRIALEYGFGLLPKPVKALALKSILRRLLMARSA